MGLLHLTPFFFPGVVGSVPMAPGFPAVRTSFPALTKRSGLVYAAGKPPTSVIPFDRRYSITSFIARSYASTAVPTPLPLCLIRSQITRIVARVLSSGIIILLKSQLIYDAKPRGYGSINFKEVCFSGCRVCAGRPIPNDRVAEPTKVEGVIAERSGGEMIVEYMQGAELAFLLDDSPKVSQSVRSSS
jgi:hypothetical protein